jgi:hypothetical protein
MSRVLLAVVLLGLLLGGLYLLYGPRPANRATVAAASAPVVPHRQVVSDAGCDGRNTVAFDISSARVGVPVEGRIGHQDACESDEIEHLSGDIDWGDGSSSAIDPGDFLGKDKDALIAAGKHLYAKSGTYALFARVRAQCSDHGQSTRVISCGSGTVQVK